VAARKTRVRPGPPRGTTYRSVDHTKQLLVDAVLRLLDDQVPVGTMTGTLITATAGVDKMYIRRYFGGLDNLLLSTLEELLAKRMKSLISTNVFDPVAGGRIDARIAQAFEIFGHLSANPELTPRLREVGEVVVHVYARQLREEFNLSEAEATREAIGGLLWVVGYLSVGHLMPMRQSEVLDWLSMRREGLRRRSR
jgi:AcrR family transcriptional regulator